MDIVKIVSFALVALFIVSLIKNDKKDVAILLSIVTGIVIFIFLLSKLTIIVNFLQTLSSKANIDVVYLDTVFKILGIAYLSSFCAEICKDAGESSIAQRLSLLGKF